MVGLLYSRRKEGAPFCGNHGGNTGKEGEKKKTEGHKTKQTEGKESVMEHRYSK